MRLPKVINRLAEKFEQLPGIGPRSAKRLVFYLLHYPQNELIDFAEKIIALKKETCLCKHCHQISEQEICAICSDPERNRHQLDRKSTRLNSSHVTISYAVFCLKKKNSY